jgi:hypothetical protein
VQRCDRFDQLPLTMFSEFLMDGKLRKLGDPSCQPLSRARDQSDTLLVKRLTIALVCAHTPFWISISRICQCFWPACSTSDGVSAASEPVLSSSACRRSKCQHSRHSAIYNTIQASDSSSEVQHDVDRMLMTVCNWRQSIQNVPPIQSSAGAQAGVPDSEVFRVTVFK